MDVNKNLKKEVTTFLYWQQFSFLLLIITLLFFQVNSSIKNKLNESTRNFSLLANSQLPKITRGQNDEFIRDLKMFMNEKNISSISLYLSTDDSFKNIKHYYRSKNKITCKKDRSYFPIFSICQNQKVDVSLMGSEQPIVTAKWIERYNPLDFILSGNKVLLILILIIFQLLYSFCFYFKKILPLSRDLRKLTCLLESSNLNYNGKIFEKFKYEEFIKVLNAITSYTNKIIKYQLQTRENEIYKSRFELAKQVAHDIRSPLTALDLTYSDTTSLDSEQKEIIKNATRRIHDIAENLLRENELAKKEKSVERLFLLYDLLNPLISEKRAQFKKRDKLNIDIEYDKKNIGIFVRVEASEFRRVISNLINNSADAIGESGNIVISFKVLDGKVVISVVDDGDGIPDNVLPKLMKKGATFGKKQGNGLGLYYAKGIIEKFGGNIFIKTQMGQGTTISIELPKETSPSWFRSNFSLSKYEKVIILDDDQSVHDVWNKNLSFYDVDSLGVIVEHFYDIENVTNYLKRNEIGQNALLFFDYEIVGSEKTGLDLLEKVASSCKATLVTSHHENERIQERCIEKNITILPKSFTPYVTFEVELKKTNVVLIDDDELIRKIWEIYASKKSMSIETFKSVGDFINSASLFSKESSIYIDSNLGNGSRGEVESEKIFNMGFSNLYIATGYDRETFHKPEWIVEIVDKQPNF